MTEADRTAFATLILGLGETYGEAVSEARMEIYFRALADLPLAEIERAASLLVRTQKFFPRPVEFRDIARGSVDDRAEMAWMKLLGMIRRVGYMGMPEWGGDEALKRAAFGLYGGWAKLCQRLPGEGPELLGYAKQFKANYRVFEACDERERLEDFDADAPLLEAKRNPNVVKYLSEDDRDKRQRDA